MIEFKKIIIIYMYIITYVIKRNQKKLKEICY